MMLQRKQATKQRAFDFMANAFDFMADKRSMAYLFTSLGAKPKYLEKEVEKFAGLPKPTW